MTRKTTNLIGILVVIVSGTYFFVFYCSSCGDKSQQDFPLETPDRKVVDGVQHRPFLIKYENDASADSIHIERLRKKGNKDMEDQNESNQP